MTSNNRSSTAVSVAQVGDLSSQAAVLAPECHLSLAFKTELNSLGVKVASRLDSKAFPEQLVVVLPAVFGGPDFDLAAVINGYDGHLVMVSSTVVYGAWPDNPVPMTEASVVRPVPGLELAARCAEGERIGISWAEAFDDRQLSIVRAAPVAGAGEDASERRFWEGPLPVGADPSVRQALAVDDLASAIDKILKCRATGVFNAAPDGWVSQADAARLRREGRFGLPSQLARWLVRVASRAGFTRLSQPAVEYSLHPWVVSSERLKQLGWRAQHDNEEVMVGVRPLPGPLARTVRRHRQDIVLGAVLTLVAAMGFGIFRGMRREIRKDQQ